MPYQENLRLKPYQFSQTVHTKEAYCKLGLFYISTHTKKFKYKEKKLRMLKEKITENIF